MDEPAPARFDTAPGIIPGPFDDRLDAGGPCPVEEAEVAASGADCWSDLELTGPDGRVELAPPGSTFPTSPTIPLEDTDGTPGSGFFCPTLPFREFDPVSICVLEAG